jgi:hypothetical protein
MMTVRQTDSQTFQKWNVIKLFSKAGHYVTLSQEFVDTPVNGRTSLFRIGSVHQMETSLSHDMLVYSHDMYI